MQGKAVQAQPDLKLLSRWGTSSFVLALIVFISGMVADQLFETESRWSSSGGTALIFHANRTLVWRHADNSIITFRFFQSDVPGWIMLSAAAWLLVCSRAIVIKRLRRPRHDQRAARGFEVIQVDPASAARRDQPKAG